MLHLLVLIFFLQNKERLLKAEKEKFQSNCKSKPVRIIADISTETSKTRRAWNNVFQELKENNCCTGGMTQVVDDLPSKQEIMSSTARTAPLPKKRK
jgi:hypothetical protein